MGSRKFLRFLHGYQLQLAGGVLLRSCQIESIGDLETRTLGCRLTDICLGQGQLQVLDNLHIDGSYWLDIGLDALLDDTVLGQLLLNSFGSTSFNKLVLVDNLFKLFVLLVGLIQLLLAGQELELQFVDLLLHPLARFLGLLRLELGLETEVKLLSVTLLERVVAFFNGTDRSFFVEGILER